MQQSRQPYVDTHMIPAIKYVESNGYYIAYQVVGEGPRDLIVIPGFASHLEGAWEEPRYERWLRRVAGYSRLILIDKRGTGLSDRVANSSLPTLEERMQDVIAVLNAVGSRRSALCGISEGGAMAVLFAATFPERTAALILSGAWGRAFRSSNYPWGFDQSSFQQRIDNLQRVWGTTALAATVAPSLAGDIAFSEWWARYQRLSASPGAVAGLVHMAFEGDVREALPLISCPTLVLHRTEDPFVDVQHGRYLAAHIPGARFVEIPGKDHLHYVGDTELYDNEFELFLTGDLKTPDPERVLSTILFTDLVGSTEHASCMGDKWWADLLARHHNIVRQQLDRYRGREIDTAGDGFFVAFDGPARAVRCARAIIEAVKTIGVEVRAGVHTGECELLGQKLAGIAVHVCARIMSCANANEVLVSNTVKDLVAGSGLQFEGRGTRTLKGIPGEWTLLAVA